MNVVNKLRTGSRTFLLVRLDIGPFTLLFLLPKKFFTFPTWSTITPKVKIHIKARTNEPPQIIDFETH